MIQQVQHDLAIFFVFFFLLVVGWQFNLKAATNRAKNCASKQVAVPAFIGGLILSAAIFFGTLLLVNMSGAEVPPAAYLASPVIGAALTYAIVANPQLTC